MSKVTQKQKLGAIIYDLPRFIWSMRPTRNNSGGARPWVLMRNREERLTLDPSRRGSLCDWEWTSDLHIAKVFPQLGTRLLKRALKDWPIQLEAEPLPSQRDVEVSFIIGHRGMSRLPHLLATLKSLAAQRGANVECLVVEQSETPEIEAHLPRWVRYQHTPLPQPEMPYCRSWAFNVGARMAAGGLLVFHDNDMLVPVDYAAELLARHRDGYEVINLKRFIFYLTEGHSQRVCSTDNLSPDEATESVMQNAQGGGSLAVARDAYYAIGGFDEAFVGWGGEDNEFWERAQTRSVWPYGYLPMVHLWHAPQRDKFDQRRPTIERFEAQSAVPIESRIEKLRGRNFGSPESLSFMVEPAGAIREASEARS